MLTITSHVNSKMFGAFGESASVQISASSDQVVYGWQGMQLDPESGLYCTHSRCYDSTIGRWLSQDPIGFAGGTKNLYQADFNSPQIYVDPSGNDAWLVQDGIHTSVVVDDPKNPGKTVTIGECKKFCVTGGFYDRAPSGIRSPNTILS